MKNKIFVIDLPTLRLDWIASEMPHFNAITKDWHRSSIEPAFPALTCSSQAALTTGAGPDKHGIIANGLFDRGTKQPEFWVFHDDKILSQRVWVDYKIAQKKTGVFFFLNINGAYADAILLPKPIHNPDGSMEMWCYHKPEGLYPDLVKTMGHFNLLKFWGPMAGIDSGKWIAEAARRTILKYDLDLSFIYLPHTDYAPQKFGPESDQFRIAHRELDGVLSDFIESIAAESPDVKFVVVSEYGMTEVTHCLKPNRVLREAGYLAVEMREGREYLDYKACRAFAMVDHQLCHIYCDPADAEEIKLLFEGASAVDIATTDPGSIGLAHERSGNVVLVAKRDAWFAYPWWEDLDEAPVWAKTIDIHNKPGYDPLEMFWDVKINGTSQDVNLIKGSHGAFPRDADQKAAVVSNLKGIEGAKSTAGVYTSLKTALGN